MGVGDGQGGLACCGPWGHKESDMIEWLNWTELNWSFPGGSAGKEPACNAGDLGLIPGLGRSPREGNGYPLQYFCLENSMDCIVYGVAKNQTRLKLSLHFTTLMNIQYLTAFLVLVIPAWKSLSGDFHVMLCLISPRQLLRTLFIWWVLVGLT